MKMIKLSEEHYIGVDESEIKEGDWISFPNLKKFVPVQYLGGDLTGYEKKITHSTQPLDCACSNRGYKLNANCAERNRCFDKVQYLPLQEVKELLGVVDVEKSMWYERNLQNPYSSDSPSNTGFKKGFELGYNQALEDNKDRKYTEKDLLDAFTWGFLEGTERGDVTDSVNKFSQSLQPKTEWEVEFVDGKLKLMC